jgi:hypothetical protein
MPVRQGVPERRPDPTYERWSLRRRGVLLQLIDELAHVIHLREIFRHRGAPLEEHAARGQPGNKRPHYVAEGSWDLVGKETGPHTDAAPLSIRMVAGACNHPNCLELPFSVELIRLAA